MTIDLAALEDPALAGYVQSIPLNVDPFPYADLQAQGRYPIQSTPDTIPQMLAYLVGLQAESGQGGRAGYVDSQHRLLVHDPSSSGGGVKPVAMTESTVFVTQHTSSPQHDVSILSTDLGNTLYYYQVVASFQEALSPASANASWRIYLKNNVSGVEMTLMFGQNYDLSQNANPSGLPFGVSVPLNPPRDVTALNGNTPSSVDLWIEDTANLMNISALLLSA